MNGDHRERHARRGAPAPDPRSAAQTARLLLPILGRVARETIDVAMERSGPRWRPGTVVTTSDNADDVVYVIIDGDDSEPSPCANHTGCRLALTQRVMVRYTPPHGLAIVQVIGWPGVGPQYFAGSTDPNSGYQLVEGDLWFDADSQTMRLWSSSDAWQEILPVFDSVAAGETRLVAGYADLTTPGPEIGLWTGTAALIRFGANLSGSAAGTVPAVGIAVSGATTIAAPAMTWPLASVGTINGPFATCIKITGLTEGFNTFTAKYQNASGTGTATFTRRWIEGQAVPT